MGEQIFALNTAGRTIRYRLRNPESARWFATPLEPCDGDRYDLFLPDEHMEFARTYFPSQTTEDYMEYRFLCVPTAEYLLRFRASIFHAVSFIWQGYAWLLSAYSGTGKTTQFIRWRQLCGQDVQIISGDMSVLFLGQDGRVWVGPSPWPGKERWSGARSAPLGGVLLLEQADENTIDRLPPSETVTRMFAQCMCRPTTEEDIGNMAALLDRILSDHPIWLLRNRGDLDSTRLSMQTIQAYLSERSST